jgi:hypothetical protein
LLIRTCFPGAEAAPGYTGPPLCGFKNEYFETTNVVWDASARLWSYQLFMTTHSNRSIRRSTWTCEGVASHRDAKMPFDWYRWRRFAQPPANRCSPCRDNDIFLVTIHEKIVTRVECHCLTVFARAVLMIS